MTSGETHFTGSRSTVAMLADKYYNSGYSTTL
ncbi:hypothetical protein A2U01_0119045, partial [Trifolium medium]|nr:hypothetical protein [Trifolium medium]